jgi:uncharacterized membrane protein
MLPAPTSPRVSTNRLRAWPGLRFLATALLAAACAGQLAAQNPAASVSVDAAANHHAINPNVYGVCFAGTADLAALNAPLNRDGGNNMSDYNWQIDALNLDNDWYFESFLQDSPITPGKAVDNFIQQTYAANVGSEPMVTIPMLPYIAKLGPNPTTSAASLWSYSVAKYGAQTGADPYQPDAGNGISAATGQRIVNDPNDAYVPNSVTIQQAWLQHILSTWGTSSTTNGIKYYILDNEPSLWNSTHVDVHPNPETYQEEYNNIVSYAAAIRAADPNAKIVAPEEWIWWAMFESGLDQKNGTGPGSDYATHNDTYYYPWLLQQLYTYQQTSGTKLIDALSVHCYNPIPGGSDDSASGQATRNQETRILWDPNFVDPSWEGTLGINGGIQNWIPTIRNWVNQYYPGLEIGCTEYNWGDETALNGATAQADVLGLYGAYGLDFATRWTVPAYPTYLAMQIYRNYDGKLSTFGDTGVSATVADPDNLSAFAAVRSSDGALTVMVINKQQGSTPVTVSLANFGTTGTAQAWQIASASQTSITSLGSVPVTSNAVSMTVPSQSITLFVIPAGSVTSPPNAPTGLAATVGSGTVTLTWVASGGATSYSVKRGTVSGGPYVTLGTVPDTSALSYTDTGLTNGTTYYYVVSATNSAGTSPNSAELAVTPIVPPTFTSSASASPNPVTQGTSTTISATVTCNANTLTNGIVQIYVVDPNGNVAATQNFTGQNLTANQSHPYTLALTPAVAGTYTVELGVFSATWQNWYWNSSAASITVNSSTVFTSSVTAPSTVALGGTATIGLTVKETGRGDLTARSVLQKRAQAVAAAGMAQLAQSFGLDLADSLARDGEILAHLFQRVLAAVFQAEPHLDDLLFARRERLQHLRGLLPQVQIDHRVGRRDAVLVDDEVAQVRLFLLADGRFERDRLLRHAQNFAHFGDRQLQPLGQLFVGRLAPEFLHHLPRGPDQLVDGLDHVHRDADGARLIGDRPRDRLPHPPGGVGGELIAAPVLELIHRLHQTDVAFLDQIQELQAAVGISLGDADHQAQIGFDQFPLRRLGLLVGLGDDLEGAAQFGRRRSELLLQLLQLLALGALLLAELFDPLGAPAGPGFQRLLDARDFALQRLQILHRGAQMRSIRWRTTGL